jgi:hypothetical protein
VHQNLRAWSSTIERLSIGFGTGPRIGFQSGPLWAVITPAEQP